MLAYADLSPEVICFVSRQRLSGKFYCGVIEITVRLWFTGPRGCSRLPILGELLECASTADVGSVRGFWFSVIGLFD